MKERVFRAFFAYGALFTGCVQSHELGEVFDEPPQDVAATPMPLVCDAGASPFGGGAGTFGDPFRICSATQLNAMRAATDSVFQVTQNIVLVDAWTPIDEFRGVLNGGGHVVTGLRIREEDRSETAFIRLLDGGEIREIAFDDIDVHGRSSAGVVYRLDGYYGAQLEHVRARGNVTATSGEVGGLIGFIEENSYAFDISFEGSVVNEGTHEATGGVIAKLFGTARRVFARAAVTSNGSTVGGLVGSLSGNLRECGSHVDATGMLRVGSIAGIAGRSQLTDCYSDGSANGLDLVGGLFGELIVDVTGTRVWSTANVAAERVGEERAIAGNGYEAGIFSEYFWDVEKTGIQAAGVGAGATAANSAFLREAVRFSEWPAALWRIQDGDYPRLANEGQTRCANRMPFDSDVPCEIPQ